MRGIAIIFVILYHILPLNSEIYVLLGTLHNSTFFLASGIVCAEKCEGRKLYTRIKKLMYPFILWVPILGVVYSMLNEVRIIDGIANAISRLWFLPTLAISFMLVNLFGNIKSEIYLIGIIIATFLSSAFGKIGFFSFLVYTGTKIKRNSENNIKQYVMAMVIYIIFYSVFVHSGIISIEDSTIAGWKLIIFLFMSFAGSYVVMYFAIVTTKLKRMKILSFIGNNTLYFYVLHFLVVFVVEKAMLSKWYEYTVAICISIILPSLYCLFIKSMKINNILFGA